MLRLGTHGPSRGRRGKHTAGRQENGRRSLVVVKMTVLFGAYGMAATLTPDAGHALLGRMGRRAEALGARSGDTVTMSVAADGVALGICERQYAGAVRSLRTVQAAHVSLALYGRLDDRSALLDRLGLALSGSAKGPGGLDSPLSDTALVLAAYQRFGIDCVEHLVGDWAFALWDEARKRLVLARDATGISALFWWRGSGQVLFSSSLPTLLAAGPVPKRLNPRWLAGLLTVFTDPAHPGATAYEDVFAVPPGHLLVVQDGQLELKRWWRPEELSPLKDTPLAEIECRFLALYEDAVQQRLRRAGGTVAATLSGGLDSGSVVALAAPVLLAQHQRLTGYVHTPRFDAGDANPGRTNNEWALANATARHVGNVDAVACPTEHISPVEGIRRWLTVAEAPSHAADNWYWLQDIAAQAAASGARVLLVGQGGNATVSYNGTGNLWPRVRELQLASVVRELQSEASGWRGAIRDRLIKPALRPAWHSLRRSMLSCGPNPAWSWLGLLESSLADCLELDAAMRKARHDPRFISTSPNRMDKFRLSLLGGADNGTALWADLGSAHGLDVRDPTRDQRLVEFCWRLPDEVFWSHGRQRGLLRSGLHSKLPTEVLACTRRGKQSADLQQRLQACRDDLLGEVSAVSRHALVRLWVDTGRLMLSAKAALGDFEPTSRGAVAPSHMMRALATAMFIARH